MPLFVPIKFSLFKTIEDIGQGKTEMEQERCLQLRNEFRQKYKRAASDFLKKCVFDLETSEPGKAAATLKRMGVQPGD